MCDGPTEGASAAINQFTNLIISLGACVASSSGKRSLADVTDLMGPGKRTKCGRLVAKQVGSRLDSVMFRVSGNQTTQTIQGGDRDKIIFA